MDEVEGIGTFLELERIVSPEASGIEVQAELAGFVNNLGVPASRTDEPYDALVRAAQQSR